MGHNCGECIGLGRLCARCAADAENIAQNAKIIELLRVLSGRNPYDPIMFDMSGLTTSSQNFPAEGGAQIEYVTLTTDTATVVTITLTGGKYGTVGKAIKFNLGANPNPSPIPLNWAVEPVGNVTLTVACAPQPVKAFAVFTLAGAEGGRYPYVD